MHHHLVTASRRAACLGAARPGAHIVSPPFCALLFVEQLVALYFLADACLISSLREGMSKVAFEFIACQQKNHGVLILSEFIGAAQTLGSGAILVNPFNTDACAVPMLCSFSASPPFPY